MPHRMEFDWDPVKAALNIADHNVSFEAAMTVFGDPLALSRLDQDHGETEDRWITIGVDHGNSLLLVVHTHVELDEDHSYIRIISARKPTKHERRQYEQAPLEADDMKDEYDFSGAVRGKFYRQGAVLVPPVHLEPEVLKYLQARAEARGTSLSQLVNELLRKDIELNETVG